MAWLEREKIRDGVASMLEVNLGVRDGEKVLIMTDPPNLSQWQKMPVKELCAALERCILARMVADIATELVPSSGVSFLPYLAVQRSGDEPDPETAKKMRMSDVIIAINNHSLTHTRATQQACEAGARIASMPGFLPQMFEGPMTASYHRISEESRRIAQMLTEAKTAILTTPSGTELTLDLEGRSGDVDIGLITTSGRCDNLPGGEAFIAPVEGKAEGKVVVTVEGYPNLEEQMDINFKLGKVAAIKGGGRVGKEFHRLLELPTAGRQPARRNLAELGIGTNPKARSVESTLEGEKIKGTVHIAIGDNAHIGGVVEADLHQDFILWKPDLLLDGRVIIKGGKWLV